MIKNSKDILNNLNYAAHLSNYKPCLIRFRSFLLSLQLHSGGDRRLLLFLALPHPAKGSLPRRDKTKTDKTDDRQDRTQSFRRKAIGRHRPFTVGIDISPDNDITVEIDSDTSVDIDRCVGLTKEIEKEFDRDEEDYRLEVGSA